jgi:hypothetical protein
MKKTISSRSLVAFLVASMAILACQFTVIQPVAAQELKPCQVTVLIVETIFAGKECVCFSPGFELYNPNDKGVYLSKFSYELDVGDHYFSGQQIPVSLYIPPKKKASFVGALPASWVGMSLWLMQIKGISMAQGMKEVVPLWKVWGGKLFNPKLKEVWGKAKAQSPEFIFTGECEISSDGVTKAFPYKAAWTM